MKPMCFNTVYTQYFPEFCEEKNHKHITRVGFEPGADCTKQS